MPRKTLFQQLFPVSWADEMEQGSRVVNELERNLRKCLYHKCYYCDIIWKNDITRLCRFKRKPRKPRKPKKPRKPRKPKKTKNRKPKNRKPKSFQQQHNERMEYLTIKAVFG